jgi:TPR repeat protein
LLATGLSAALLALPAGAAEPVGATASAEEQTAVNTIAQVWSRYIGLMERHDPAAADAVADSTVRHYAFLRDVALYASPEQLQRLPAADRLSVYGLRARRDADTLAGWDGRETYRQCVSLNLCDASMSLSPSGAKYPMLSHVAMIDSDRALGEIKPQTNKRYAFGPGFVRENGQWKVRPERSAAQLSELMDSLSKQAGSETGMMQFLLVSSLGADYTAAPLDTLKQALRDDGAARGRLDAEWPDYAIIREAVLAALARKAEDGEPLAQFIYGHALYSGDPERKVAPDKERGLAMMQRASDAGHLDASVALAQTMLDPGPDQALSSVPVATLRRALPYIRVGADGGDVWAMTVYAQLLQDGAAGLTRNCTESADWRRKAEEAGLEFARNDRVWVLATCAEPSQRDPKQALALAQPMIKQRATLSSGHLDTIAAVYAANGDFTQAVRFQQLAIKRLEPDVDEPDRERIRERLSRYQQRHDYTDQETSFTVER